MTHDELLEEIDRYLVPTLAESEIGNKAIGILKALHSVVEMHKPNEFNECINCKDEWGYNDVRNESYPCPTIQAIEKELG